jgi:hypothetical protein
MKYMIATLKLGFGKNQLINISSKKNVESTAQNRRILNPLKTTVGQGFESPWIHHHTPGSL